MIWYFPVPNYFSTKYDTKMKDYYGRNEKSAAGENFRNRDYFYTKNSAKMQKNWPTENSPPGGGGQKMYLIWEFPPPARGKITENSPPPLGEGGFTPS